MFPSRARCMCNKRIILHRVIEHYRTPPRAGDSGTFSFPFLPRFPCVSCKNHLHRRVSHIFISSLIHFLFSFSLYSGVWKTRIESLTNTNRARAHTFLYSLNLAQLPDRPRRQVRRDYDFTVFAGLVRNEPPPSRSNDFFFFFFPHTHWLACILTQKLVISFVDKCSRDSTSKFFHESKKMFLFFVFINFQYFLENLVSMRSRKHGEKVAFFEFFKISKNWEEKKISKL